MTFPFKNYIARSQTKYGTQRTESRLGIHKAGLLRAKRRFRAPQRETIVISSSRIPFKCATFAAGSFLRFSCKGTGVIVLFVFLPIRNMLGAAFASAASNLHFAFQETDENSC